MYSDAWSYQKVTGVTILYIAEEYENKAHCAETSHPRRSRFWRRRARPSCARMHKAEPYATGIFLAASATGTSTDCLVARVANSTRPADSFLPTVMRKGTPIRSASLNFTPGRSSRSSDRKSVA